MVVAPASVVGPRSGEFVDAIPGQESDPEKECNCLLRVALRECVCVRHITITAVVSALTALTCDAHRAYCPLRRHV